MSQSSTEEDENKVNHEILRSEVLYMITDESIIDEDVLTKSLDPYSLMKIQEPTNQNLICVGSCSPEQR